MTKTNKKPAPRRNVSRKNKHARRYGRIERGEVRPTDHEMLRIRAALREGTEIQSVAFVSELIRAELSDASLRALHSTLKLLATEHLGARRVKQIQRAA